MEVHTAAHRVPFSAKTLALKEGSIAALDDSRVCTSGFVFPTTEITMTANIFRFL
jgi:hypothetical protein